MTEIMIATKNAGKVKDFEQLFGAKGWTVKSLLDFADAPDVEETGTTFAENAILKAEALANELGIMVVADDSGLEIDALDGRPGVYSARYAGEEKSDEKNIDKVLAELADVPVEKRTARFRCALALAKPGAETIVAEGSCEGRIAFERSGENGFGYDPVFFVPELNVTMAQLTKEQKGAISHRGNALKALQAVLFAQ